MKLYLTSFIAVLLVLVGCKVVDKFTKFNLDYNETVIIPKSQLINLPIDIATPEMETNTESEFASNDTRKDKIEEIKLTQMTLSVLSPADGDFGFLKTISIFISAEGLEEIKIASKDVVPENAGSTLDLDTVDSDLKAYIKKDKFKLRVEATTDETTAEDYKINVYSKFFVDAKILGV